MMAILGILKIQVANVNGKLQACGGEKHRPFSSRMADLVIEIPDLLVIVVPGRRHGLRRFAESGDPAFQPGSITKKIYRQPRRSSMS
jgi:hypothetical protein